MNHPSHAELVDFFDGELATARQAEVAAHVAACGECGERIATWRGVRQQLPLWTLPERVALPAARGRARFGQTLLRVAAAIVLVATGFTLARLTAKGPDTEQMRVELAQQIGDELRGELASELNQFAAAQAYGQRAHQQAVVDSVEQLDARWLANFRELRKDIETVAVRTQAEFSRLASLAP